jgi:hypothetical protein
MAEPSPAHCRLIVPILCSRDGLPTEVLLSGDRSLTVLNIAWGEDIGDDYEHLTSNVSPTVDGGSIDLFFTDEVLQVLDPQSGAILWETDGIPSVR